MEDSTCTGRYESLIFVYLFFIKFCVRFNSNLFVESIRVVPVVPKRQKELGRGDSLLPSSNTSSNEMGHWEDNGGRSFIHVLRVPPGTIRDRTARWTVPKIFQETNLRLGSECLL